MTDLRRRALIAGGFAAGVALAARKAWTQQANPECRRCRGLGLVPDWSAKPFVFVGSQGTFKAEEAAIGQPCPLCQGAGEAAARVEAMRIEEARQQHAQALAQHSEWEERLGQKLLFVQTRHVSIHTELKAADARRVGEKVEECTRQIQKACSSLSLVPTRPAGYQQMLLWGEDSWHKFREAMQQRYTPEQLGESWHNAGRGTMYDHPEVAHAYFTARSVRDVAPEFSAIKLAATRQIWVATGQRAPAWLIEGFASYAQHAVLGLARSFTIYALDRGPGGGVTLAEASRQSAAGQFRPWDKLLARELRDFEKSDYPQSLAMVAFLLDTEPAKFLRMVELIKGRTPDAAALEEAFSKNAAEVEAACGKWLAGR